MKKFFISIMSLIVGISGYAVVEKTIEDRVATLESQVAELQGEFSDTKPGNVGEIKTDILEYTNEFGEYETDKNGEIISEIITVLPDTTIPVTELLQNKEEIINRFNIAVNSVKTNAKSVQQIKITNYLAGTLKIGSGIKPVYNALGGDNWLDKTIQSSGLGEATYKGSDICEKFPVENESWASKLTVDDVAEAKCISSNGVYTIIIKTKADEKTTSVQHGEGHNPKVFSVVLLETINDNIPSVAKNIVGNVAMEYPAGTIIIRVDKATGHIFEAEYTSYFTINLDEVDTSIPLATKSVYRIYW